MSDWWSRRLADTAPKQDRVQSSSPPVTPPVHVPISFPKAPSATPQQVAQSRNQLLDASRAPTEQLTMGEALRLWQGGEAMRKEGGSSCPSCGSRHVFSRVGRGSGTMINGSQPAPRCFECGWNGMYDQGEQSSWAV